MPDATSYIVSQAFRFAEITPPSSLSDGSDKARTASELYPAALGMILEREDWSFARRYTELPQSDVTATHKVETRFGYAYELPADFVHLRHVYADEHPWRKDGRYIFTSFNGTLPIRYTQTIEQEDLLPHTFRMAVATQLALLLSPEYVKSRTKRDQLADSLSGLVGQALEHDRATASQYAWDGDDLPSDWREEAVQ